MTGDAHTRTVRMQGMLSVTRYRTAALALLLLAFALRVYRLDYQELRGDEAFGYFFAQRTYANIVEATIDLAEPHPVGSYYILKSWLTAAGDSEFALRFPSAWFGVLAVALLLRLAWRLGFRRGPALLAAGLLTISPYAIWHGQDARMYSMSLALTIAAVWLGVETLQRQRPIWGLAYVAVAWAALHTHYFAGFVLAALNLFVLTRAVFVARTRANLPAWLLWQTLIVVAYLPWLSSAASIVGGYEGNGDSPPFAEMLHRAAAVFAAGESTSPSERILWAAVAAALLLIGSLRLLLNSPYDRRTLWLLVCYLAVPVLATWWSAQSRPIFNERYLVAAAPPFFLLIAAAFEGRQFAGGKERLLHWAAVLLTLLLIGGMLRSLVHHYADPAYSKTRGWRELAAALEQLSAGVPPEQVRIAQNFPDPTLWYYYRGPVEHSMLPPAPQDEAGAQAAVEAMGEDGVRRILLPVQPAPNWDDRDIAGTALGNSPYDLVHEQPVGVWPLRIYAGQPSLNIEKPLDGQFQNGIALAGVSNLDGSLPTPGGLLAPTLFATVPDIEAYATLKLTVQLLDGAGRLVAQQDLPLSAWHAENGIAFIRTYGLPLPSELAPGEYRLIAALYDGAAEDAPRILTVDGNDTVELATMLLVQTNLADKQ